MDAVPSSQQFADAFMRMSVTDLQLKMLAIHYQATGHILTAGQLARAVGYSHHAPACASYGALSRKLSKELRWYPPTDSNVRVAALVTFSRPAGHWRWHMRPQVATALEKLGWVSPMADALPDETSDATTYVEGAVTRTTINAYERNPAARIKCVEHHGYACAVCGILLADFYGEIGERYIHVHHLRPLSELGAEYQIDPVNDLRPVCPNCHAMLHRRTPPYTIDEIRREISDKVRTLYNTRI